MDTIVHESDINGDVFDVFCPLMSRHRDGRNMHYVMCSEMCALYGVETHECAIMSLAEATSSTAASIDEVFRNLCQNGYVNVHRIDE